MVVYANNTVCTAGLFLHVGYSVKDQRVIEANTPVLFRVDSVSDKLGTLLNEDSAEQVWHLANNDKTAVKRQRSLIQTIRCILIVQGGPKSEPLNELSLKLIKTVNETRLFRQIWGQKKHKNIISWCHLFYTWPHLIVTSVITVFEAAIW